MTLSLKLFKEIELKEKSEISLIWSDFVASESNIFVLTDHFKCYSI